MDVSQLLTEPLTQKQIKVAQLIACGLTNQEIAKQMGISLSTVKTHALAIAKKWKSRNRAHIAATVVRLHY